VAEHYYKIEFANADDREHKLYTYETLQRDPEYQKLVTREPKNQNYFDLRAQGKI